MIDKQEYYHGVAIIRLLEDPRCCSIAKSNFGYIVNKESYIFLKYSTKARSPWRFSFKNEEIIQLNKLISTYSNVVTVLICGGDGICVVCWTDTKLLLGNEPGWIAVKRKYNECYSVTGSHGKLKNKVPLQQWPILLFTNSREVQNGGKIE